MTSWVDDTSRTADETVPGWKCGKLSHPQQLPELSVSISPLRGQGPSYSTLAALEFLSILPDSLFTRDHELQKSRQINKRLSIELLPL